MPDVFSKAKRSAVMAMIRSRGNKDTELALAKLFRAYHIRGWRRHTALFGRPDFTFRARRIVVFVDGCFWHGCPTCYRAPGTNGSFWAEKRERNRRRDILVNKTLREKKWKVVRIWEHELRATNAPLLRRRILQLLRLGLG